MIARQHPRLQPIPFANPARPQVAATASEPEPQAWAKALQQLTQASTRDPSGDKPKADIAPSAEPRPANRQARARYDGPHALSIRSATSGRHYRFEHPGAEQVIDAIDITMLRRIDGITIL